MMIVQMQSKIEKLDEYQTDYNTNKDVPNKGSSRSSVELTSSESSSFRIRIEDRIRDISVISSDETS